jgi:hypothetical protein
LQFAAADVPDQGAIHHFQVAASSAAEDVPMTGRHLHQGQSRYGLKHPARGIIDAAVAAQIAGVMIRHHQVIGVEWESASLNELLEELSRV